MWLSTAFKHLGSSEMSDSVCESMVAALSECGVNFLAVVSLFVKMLQYDKFSIISEEQTFIVVERS